MRSELGATGLCVLIPAIVAFACEPGSDKTDSAPAPSTSTTATGTVPFGGPCADSSTQRCAEGECYAVLDDPNEFCESYNCQGVCTRKCESDADCTETTRCTTSPRGVLCLPRCDENSDCAYRLSCARAGADGVCWDPSQPGGEIKFRAEFSVISLNLKAEFDDSVRFNAGVWRLVPDVPALLSVGVLNTGSIGGTYTATVRAENEWIQIVQSGSGLALPTVPTPDYGFAPAPSGWVEGIKLVANEGIPVNTPLPMTLVLVKEGGLEETAIPFTLTSIPSTLRVNITSLAAQKLSDLTGVFNETGYLLYIQGMAKGFGGAVFTKARVVSGATEIPIPAEVLSRFYNAQFTDGPFWGVERSPPSTWGAGSSAGAFRVLAIAELPTGPITVELSERTENVWQATLPVVVQ